MLSDSSLGLITFINLFFIPLFSLRIYCKRNSIEWNFNFELFFRYALYCILNLPFTRTLCSFIERMFGATVLAESTKYTLFAIVTAAILPFLVEIVEHFIKVDVVIKHKNKSSKDKEQK